MDLRSAVRAVNAGVTQRARERFGPARAGDDATVDDVVVEEPLEIRVDDETIAVTMRTPGQDARLALGYLHAEGIIRSLHDVGTVAHCGRPGSEGYGNVIAVRVAPGVAVDVARVLDACRFTFTTASCGVCGRRTVDDLTARCTPLVPGEALFDIATVATIVEALRDVQPNFSRTGGLHAAAAYDRHGELLAAHEDIGRHNAVDKVVGDLLYAGLLGGPPALLSVSGRASFEIVQKAAAARIPVVACVSAVSSLAVDLAIAMGITLVGFVRGGSLSVYTHPQRVR